MKLNNTTIYSSSTSLYLANGDHNLIEVTGADVSLVEAILTGVAAADSLDSIYERLRADCDEDRDYFNDLVAWLVDQGIVLSGAAAAPAPIATYVHAPFATAAVRSEILAQLTAAAGQVYALADHYEDAQLLLLFAPLFEYQPEVQRLNQHAYQRQVPLCHVGVDPGTFTVGPLVDAALGTPCLSCYVRRKLANLKNPQKTLSFMHHPNKARLTHADPRANPYFGVALTHLAVELDKYFAHGRQLSPILGKSLVFDHLDYSLTKSKVLRVPGCEVCNPASVYAAFNP